MEIKVIIADDHAIMREGLKSLLEKYQINVVAIANNGREAIELAIKHQPDIMIMDIAMPDLNGMEATLRIKQELPDVKIIALSMHSSKKIIDRMFVAGASGYILKESAFTELFEAIQEVNKGNFYLSPAVARMFVDTHGFDVPKTDIRPKFNEISRKEREILQLIAEGEKTRDIAGKLNISIKTVETHRRNIMKKLNIFSVAGSTKFAIKEGIISLD
ncbi:MAG: response regulator transcription factor [Desulfobacteraceae bacterium]|nr:response regulator transcription factor [Desulfobacteraceae bacterium]